jgi:hypothetical protein
MASLASQTNINTTRYFFATTEAGEQVLNTETQAAGNLTDFYVAISGPQGNAVQINQMPDVIGTVTTGGEEMLYAGTASTYKTLSSLSATATGISLSTDRIPGSGIATIESYASNGTTGGYEFLSRGVNGALLSTPLNSYLSSLGRPGATAVLGASGQFVAGQGLVAPVEVALSAPDLTGAGIGAFTISDLSGTNPLGRWSFYKFGNTTGGNAGTNLALAAYDDAGTFINPAMVLTRSNAAVSTINQYAYPQSLLSTVGVANQTGVSVPAGSPTVIYTIANNNLINNAVYLADVAFQWQVGSPGATGNWIQLGVRLGGNGGFNYDVPQYIPPGGTGVAFINNSVGQITDMGNTNKNIDVVAFHNNATAISISTNTITGGAVNFFKQIT